LTIINDILDFSKIEAGRMELEYQPFDLRECIEGAFDLLATVAANKGLDIGYLVEAGTPAAVVGDMTRLRQVLVNLLNNAVKFTDEGEVVLSVDARPLFLQVTDVDGEHGEYELHFAVKDTGIGIPADRMDRLFQSFTQIDASTTRKYGGTGLGLPISKRLSELMGGTMWVESEVGQGSTFHFTLQAKAAPRPRSAYLQEHQPNLNGKRILIVDDNATNRRILALQTRAWGMYPRAAASAAEALGWVHQGEPFELGLVDMHMPDMDGVMLATEIRRERDAKALPLVMLTSLGRQEAGESAAEFAAFLTKPVKASQLYEAVVSILAEGPRERGDAVAPSQFDSSMGQRMPLRILLAEDNAVNQKLALRLLERLGYRADVVGNGLEAIESLQRQSYDVVLMDVQMPEMDGLEATRTICQKWPRQVRPRIIAMTANAMQEDRETCLAAGMDDYVSKPIRVEELVGALGECQPLTSVAHALSSGGDLDRPR
jgi:CheY-like chemotaxis protein